MRHVEVKVRRWRQNRAVAGVGHAVGQILGVVQVVPDIEMEATLSEQRVRDQLILAPQLDLACTEFLPARSKQAAFAQQTLDPVVEIVPDVGRRGQLLTLHQGLRGGRFFPGTIGQFIGADMDGAQGRARLAMQRNHGVDHTLDEGVGRGQARIHDIVGIELGRAVLRLVVRVAQQVATRALSVALLQLVKAAFHGFDGGAGMTRHFNLGDDLDMARRRVAEDFNVVGSAVMATAVSVRRIRPGAVSRLQVRARIQRVTAPRAHLDQFRQAGDVKAPAFVVGQVQMEFVQLVARHQIKQTQQCRLGLEVARHIELHTAVAETRRVADFHGRQRDALRHWPRQRQQLAQRLQTACYCGR